jgi:hypothetical protein
VNLPAPVRTLQPEKQCSFIVTDPTEKRKSGPVSKRAENALSLVGINPKVPFYTSLWPHGIIHEQWARKACLPKTNPVRRKLAFNRPAQA